MGKSMVVKLQFVSVIDKRLRATVVRFAWGELLLLQELATTSNTLD